MAALHGGGACWFLSCCHHGMVGEGPGMFSRVNYEQLCGNQSVLFNKEAALESCQLSDVTFVISR